MRKVGILTLFILMALVLTLTLTVGAASPKASAAAVAAAPASPAAAPMPPHPHITEGLEAMRAAKHHLEMADHDFHGHRVKAIEHLDQAIHEAEECEREP